VRKRESTLITLCCSCQGTSQSAMWHRPSWVPQPLGIATGAAFVCCFIVVLTLGRERLPSRGGFTRTGCKAGRAHGKANAVLALALKLDRDGMEEGLAAFVRSWRQWSPETRLVAFASEAELRNRTSVSQLFSDAGVIVVPVKLPAGIAATNFRCVGSMHKPFCKINKLGDAVVVWYVYPCVLVVGAENVVCMQVHGIFRIS
jgi:hypothetical protein